MSPDGRDQQSPEGGVAARCAALRAAGLPIYLTPDEVAELFQLPSAHYVTRNADRWPHIRIARQIRFTPEQVEAIAREHLSPVALEVAGVAFPGRITRRTRYKHLED